MMQAFSNQFSVQLKKVLLGSMLMLMALILGACSDDTTNGDGTTPPFVSPFDLGKDFTITSLGDGKTFVQADDNNSIFSATDINSVGKNETNIKTELQTNIKTKLEGINKDSTVDVKDPVVLSGEVGLEKTLVITVDATITETANATNTETNGYTFTIAFNNNIKVDLRFDLGTTFTIGGLDGDTFTQATDNKSKFSVIDIHLEGKDNDIIASQLKTAIENKLAPINQGSTVIVGTLISTGTIGVGSTVTVTAPITIQDNSYDDNKKTETHEFKITYIAGFKKWDGTPAVITPIGDVYEIYYGSQLAWIAEQSNLVEGANDFATKTVRFMNSVDMDNNSSAVGKVFTGIGKFAGKLDGNHKMIYGLKIVKEKISEVGLISILGNGGSIDNLTIAKGGSIKGYGNVGAFVGAVVGNVTITGVTNHATVEGDQAGIPVGLLDDNSIGGIVGHSMSISTLTLSNSSNTGTVTGADYVGGLIGASTVDGNNLTIENSSNTGNVEGGEQVGGLVGRSKATLKIDNSSNVGTVTGATQYVGGLVGKGENTSTIDNSSNTGNVTGVTQYVGGLIGMITAKPLTISNSSNIGNVIGTGTGTGTGTGKSVGGIIGSNSSMFSPVILTNVHSYAKSVTGTEKVGGIIGENNRITPSTANNVYWLHDNTDGIADAVGGGTLAGTKALNKAEFADATNVSTNFNGWDFVNVWEILANGKYPTLKNLVIPVKP